MNIEQFCVAMIRYKKIQPFGAPDFNDDFVAEYWFKKISHYGAENLSRAMQKLCEKSKFPCIEDVRRECGEEEVSDEAVARDIAEKIYYAIGAFGSHNYKGAKEYLGDLADKVIGGGAGWMQICETTTTSQAGMHKAQWRESAKGHLEMARKGVSGPHRLPPVNEGVKALMNTTRLLNE